MDNAIGLSLNKKEYHNKNKVVKIDGNGEEEEEVKIHWLDSNIDNIRKEIQQLQNEENEHIKNLEPFKLQIKQLEDTEKRNLDKVHIYNEIKDSSQAMIGKLAELEGLTIVQMNKKLGVILNDDEK